MGNSEKVSQILLKFSLYFLAATQTFELQKSFSIDRIVAGEAGYFITLAYGSSLIQKDGQIYVELFQVFFCGFHFRYTPRENTEHPKPLIPILSLELLKKFEVFPTGLALGGKESEDQNFIAWLF